MELMKEAHILLAECETGLRRLLSRAATAADYDAIFQITSLARSLARLRANSVNDTAPIGRDIPRVNEGARKSSQGSTDREGQASKKRRLRKRKSERPPGKYPKFFRRGDDIIKVGWSKKDQREYQHKSPGKYLSVIAQAIELAGPNGRIVATQDVFPIKDPETGMEIPSYQAYLCLALLREAGLVEQEGRQGHKVTAHGSVTSQALLVWESLPQK